MDHSPQNLLLVYTFFWCVCFFFLFVCFWCRLALPKHYFSFSSSDGNASLLDEGGSASQVPQATVELAGYGSVVWPDSLSEWLVDGAGLQ